MIVLAGGILLGLSLAAAFLWPATYKSMATILIEEQGFHPNSFIRRLPVMPISESKRSSNKS
jgi:uncharacterized protein involved in exopolysaccharide biosynthesis